MNNSKRIVFVLFFLSVVGMIIYSNTLHSPFQYDDEVYVEKNYSIKTLDGLREIALKKGWRGRSVGMFSFYLNYKINRLEVFGYHAVNAAIHIINSILIYFLSMILFRIPKIKLNEALLSRERNLIALIISLLFLVHPIQTSAVSYISQRLASLATLFYLASVILYLKARIERKKVFLVFSGVIALLGMFTKETVFTLPIIIMLFEYLFFIKEGSGKLLFKRAIVCSPFLLIIPALFDFNFSKTIFDFRIASGSHDGDIITWQTYFLTQFRVVATYIQKLFFPVNLNLDYDFPLSHSFFEIKTFICFLFLISILIAAIKLREKNVLVSLGIFWFFICLSVESSVIPIHHVIFEHRVYLPFFGFALALVCALFKIIKNKKALVVFFLSAAVVLSVLTYNRNKVWMSKISLWADSAQKSPNKHKPYLNLGNAYLENREYDLALKYLNKALELNPKYTKILDNIGGLYLELGNFDLSYKYYDQVIKIDPFYADAYINIGLIYALNNQFDLAMQYYDKGINLNPDIISAYINRGNLLSQQKEYVKAIEDYNRALKIDSDNWGALNNLGNVYKVTGELDKAFGYYTKGITLNPQMAIFYVNRGMIYKAQGELKKAIADFSKAIEIDGNQYAYLNRAITYESLGKYKLALKDFLRAKDLGYNVDEEKIKYLSSLIGKNN